MELVPTLVRAPQVLRETGLLVRLAPLAFWAERIAWFQLTLSKSSGFKPRRMPRSLVGHRAHRSRLLRAQARINSTEHCSTIFAMMCWMRMTGLQIPPACENPKNDRTILVAYSVVPFICRASEREARRGTTVRTVRFSSSHTKGCDCGCRRL